MQNTVDERKQNGDDFFLSLAVTYFRSGNCPANGLVTEQPQYSVAICFFTTWQNTETMLISNGLRFIFICSLSLALPCIFHMSRFTFATTVCLTQGVPIESLSQMMGHLSIKTTQFYAEVTRTKIDEDMTNLAKTIESKYDLSDAPTKKWIRKVVFANE